MAVWRIASASVPGTSHLARNESCQDYHLVDYIHTVNGPEFLVIAVADGAGSASRSEEGSRRACSAAILSLKENTPLLRSSPSVLDAVRLSFEAARHDVEDLATREELTPRDFACTLLVAVIGEAHSVFGQVGDGALVYGDGNSLTLVEPQPQESLNLTDFLVSGRLSDTLTLTRHDGAVTRVACMTDGVTPFLIDFRSQRPHTPICDRLFTTCQVAPDPSGLDEDLCLFLESDAVNERTDDDKTLVLAFLESDSSR